MAALALALASCSGGADPPTLAPGTTAVVTEPPTTVATTITTTTQPPTTSTTGVDARFAEIESMANEAFVGRLRAIYFKDKEALLEWVGSKLMYDSAVETIENDSVAFVSEPTPENSSLDLLELYIDREDCIAALVARMSASVDATDVPVIQIWFPKGDDRLLVAEQWAEGTNVGTLTEECDLILREWEP